jgi:hypothetical protein
MPERQELDPVGICLSFHVFWNLDVVNEEKKKGKPQNHKSAVVNGVRTGPGERRVRAEGRTLILCVLFRLAVASRWMRATWTRGHIAALARVRPHGSPLARGSRLVHADCMVLYTPPHVHT